MISEGLEPSRTLLEVGVSQADWTRLEVNYLARSESLVVHLQTGDLASEALLV